MIEKECDERCTCEDSGDWKCSLRCGGVFIKRGKLIDDPMCYEKPAKDDDCCAVMVCADDQKPEDEQRDNGGYNQNKIPLQQMRL